MSEEHVTRILRIGAVIVVAELLLIPTAILIGFAVRAFLWASGLGQ